MITTKLDGLSFLGEFRYLSEFIGDYAVSDLGFVVSFKGEYPRLLWGSTDADGYRVVTLTSEGAQVTRRVHLLVIKTFRGERPWGRLADHINRDRQDNRSVNLRWVTPKENSNNANMVRGEKHSSAKLTKEQAQYIARSDMPQKKLAEAYQVSQTTISKIKRGLLWAHTTGVINDND